MSADRLDVHVTDGGAVYVTDNHRFEDASFVVRMDSDINRNPESMGRLFAAAPDLLAVVERVVECADKEPASCCVACAKLARAALARARGSAVSP